MGQLLFALRCYKGMQRGAKGEKEGGTLLRWFGTQILNMGEYGKGPHCVVCNFHVTVS